MRARSRKASRLLGSVSAYLVKYFDIERTERERELKGAIDGGHYRA